MSQLSYWHVRWVVPAALVQAALELGGGDVERGLRLIAERGETWMRGLALELQANKRELSRILEDLEDGLRPDPEIVRKIISTVLNNEKNN